MLRLKGERFLEIAVRLWEGVLRDGHHARVHERRNSLVRVIDVAQVGRAVERLLCAHHVAQQEENTSELRVKCRISRLSRPGYPLVNQLDCIMVIL